MTIPRRNKQNYADFISDNMASSYHNSSEEQTELRRLHIKLISEINDNLDENSIEYKNLIFHFGTYVPRGLIANKSSLDIFETLCTRNIITPGENYEKLKQICRDSGNDIYVDTIEKYEKKMEKVRSQHRYTGPQEAEKKHTESKRKFTVPQTEQKEEIKRRKVEESPKQKQLKYENAKSGMLYGI
ncbi:uncharacterized protein LOC132724705 [Ruditapes philippinarum]|uniref:uncharacterized protein LOC132724705 n=1 Tax=Ruditapes philippinarum TaxID=129788 RepID=UPI00295AB7E6|nr:uncharacterized protein LOC132724705 [Ruditapes philippinarum]